MPEEDVRPGLERFVEAQRDTYALALSEVRAGRKRTHWMWFIFPQLAGLGFSETARYYGIRGIDEARAYLAHPVLGPRLVEVMEAAVAIEGRSALEVFGHPDDLKLRSCATLFARASPPGSVFERALTRYFPEGPDPRTLQTLDGRDGPDKPS
jgi:uncharacterized protein (DUF1810 family)